MANTIDLATYVARFEADTSEIDKGFGNADATLKEKLGGMVNWSKVAVGGAIVGVVAGVGKVIKEGVDATAELDEQMSSFQATTGATGEEVEDMRKLAQDLFKTNTDSIEDIVATSEAMKQVMGLTTEEIENSQQAMMDYAKTTGRDNAEVVKSVGKIGKAWDLSADEMVGATDMFKASSEKFGTDIGAVEKAMQDIRPASKALGISFEETNGIMNMMADSGLDVEQSVKALNYAAKTVESPEEFRTMLEDIQAIEDPTQRTQKAVELFGSRAGVAMSSVLDGTTDLDEFILTMDETEGTVNSASDAFDNNFNVQLELAKKMFMGLVQQIGEKFMPILNIVLDWITEHLPQIENVVKTTMDVIGTVVSPIVDLIKHIIKTLQYLEESNNETWNQIKETVESVFNILVGVLEAFSALFRGDWEKLGQSLVKIGKNFWKLIKNVFELALKAIEGILKLAITGFKKLGKLIMKGLWSGFKFVWKKIIQWFSTIFKNLIKWITGLGNKFVNVGKKIITSIWNGFKIIWTNVLGWFSNIFNNLIQWIIGLGERFINTGKSIMSFYWDGLKIVWTTVLEWFGTIFENLFEWFGGLKDRFFNIGHNMFDWMWDGLKSVWSNIRSWVKDKVSWLKDKLAFWRSSKSEMNEPIEEEPQPRQYPRYPKYDVGTPFVPNDQLAFIHKGEAVIPAKYNPYNSNSNSVNKSNGTSGGDNIYYINEMKLPNVTDFDSFVKDFNKNLTDLPNKAVMKVKKIGR